MSPELQETVFRATSALTDHFHGSGARFLDATLRPVVGSRLLAATLAHRNLRVVRKARTFARFLVVADSHIGDAIPAIPTRPPATLPDFWSSESPVPWP